MSKGPDMAKKRMRAFAPSLTALLFARAGAGEFGCVSEQRRFDGGLESATLAACVEF
jgi:hypothetical protein